MTTKNLQDFFHRMKTDNEFRDRILAIDDIDDRITAINSEGFEIDKNEILEFGQSIMQLASTSRGGCMPYYYLEESEFLR